MSHAFQNQLFLASAGTGKTYRLASHFVGLLAREVAPERILATTFTKKAAGEILGRVWQRLVEVAQDPDAAQALSEAIGETVTCDQVRAVLPGLARQIHRFRVSTLDAHTMQVVRLFEAELGLPAGWNIVDEVTDGELRDEALSEALRAGDEASWGALLKGLDPTGERRGVFDHVRSQIRELRDKVLESEEAAWTQIHVPQGPGEHALQAAIDGLKAFDDLPLTKTKKPRVNYLRAQKEAIERAEQSQWEELLSKGMIPKLLANETVFGGAEIPEALQAILRVLAQEGVHRLLAQVYQRNESSYRLIQRFEEAYAAFKREHGVLRFDDLMRFLDPLAVDNPFGEQGSLHLDDVWMRLDARIDHLLLDEFQDTSSVQWRSLQALADEIASTHEGQEAGGRSLFCVGDVKQSIYGWRQGEPELLPMLAERYGIEGQTLAENYRSSPLIMDLCNQVFPALPEVSLAQSEPEGPFAKAAQRFAGDYPAHQAKRTQLGGAWQVWQVDPEAIEDSEARKRETVRLTAERIAALREAAPHASIGVLFRARKSIPALLHRLQSAHGLRASGEGGNPLTDAEAVAIVASGLHWIDHPGDLAAAYHVGTSPLRPCFGIEAWQPDERGVVPGRDRAWQRGLVQAAQRVRATIARTGFSAWLLELQPLVVEHFGAWDQQRFEQLIDHADRFQSSDPLRPARWAVA